MCVLGVMLGGTPHLVVGFKVKEGGGDAPPNELENGEFRGEQSVGAVERVGVVKGGGKAPLPPYSYILSVTRAFARADC